MKHYLRLSFSGLNRTICLMVIVVSSLYHFLGSAVLDVGAAIFSLKLLICGALVTSALTFEIALILSLRRDVLKGYKNAKRIEKKKKKIEKKINPLGVKNE